MDDSIATGLTRKITERSALVGIVGLGHVGIPLSIALHASGFELLGFDIDSKRVQELNASRSPLTHIDDSMIAAMVTSGRYQATTDFSNLAKMDVIILCVPTPFDPEGNPNLKPLIAATESVANHLRTGQLVVLECTSYPGTTRNVVAPILKRSGLRMESDFFLAYSSEREDPGNRNFSLKDIPKIVSGIESTSRDLAVAFYSQFVKTTVTASSCEAAEASKLIENVYRHVNIALANEWKTLFQGSSIDIWEVISLAASKPFGFQPFWPGPGSGGPCIPTASRFLSWYAQQSGKSSPLIDQAELVNQQMPWKIIELIEQLLAKKDTLLASSRIGVLGVAYKKDVSDVRQSGSIALLSRLSQLSVAISYSDPFVASLSISDGCPFEMQSCDLTSKYLQSLDAIVIGTDHSVFNFEWIVNHSALVIDTRNATKHVLNHRDRIHFA